MLLDWNFWLSVITAITAVVALFLGFHQTKLSNKQSLFDRRLKAYLVVQGLFNLCKQNYKHLLTAKSDEPYFENDVVFALLTNNTYLYQVSDTIKHPLEQPFHIDFLKKLEELKELSLEIKLIFHDKTAVIYSDFVFTYQEVLFAMYQYQMYLNYMLKANMKKPMPVQDAANQSGEPEWRKCLNDKMHKLRELCDLIENAESKETIKKQVTLK